MRKTCSKIVLLIGTLWASPTVAADLEARHEVLGLGDWTIAIGAEGRLEPLYVGSSRTLVRPYPIFDVRRAGAPEHFHAPRDGIGIAIFEGSNYQVGPVGQFRTARREKDDPALTGLGDVPWAPELGLFGEYWPVSWLRTRAELRQGFHGHTGQLADVMVDGVFPFGRQLTLSGGPRVTFASSGATAPYFSIDALQSAASGLPTFDAHGGLRSYGAGTQARYVWTPQWATHAFVEYERLTGDAARSPLVAQRGSPNQVTIGVGASRSFNIKSFWE
jgi:MipA family protein